MNTTNQDQKLENLSSSDQAEQIDKIIAFVNSKGYTGGDNELRQLIAEAHKGYTPKPAPEDYDSLETNPLINTSEPARAIENILRGYEPVADGHGNPKGLDLNKDLRTEFGYYWEFEDIAEAATKIAGLLAKFPPHNPTQETK